MTSPSLALPAARPSPLLLLGVPLSTMAYPLLLQGFHAAVARAQAASLALAALLLLGAILVPVVGFLAMLRLGKHACPTSDELMAKWLCLLAIASAPIYTAMGVLLYMVGDPIGDIPLWLGLWVLGAGLMAKSAFASPAVRPSMVRWDRPTSPRLRVAHGISAVAILLLFLAMHLSNHLAGLLSEAAHRSLMDLFRHVYRARLIEPLVVALFLFMVGSGLMLVAGHAKQKADVFRTLQIVSGVYLVFFILGHMNSVFFYARTLLKIQTDWNFATGAPTGLIQDAWNIRLLPHYLLGVFLVLTHLVLGARGVAIAHRAREAAVDKWTWVGISIAAVVALAIIVGMSGQHLLP